MAQPATKIWCPKCHKRHRLPPNAGGMTLRCRGCQFAFRVQDGLTQDPGEEVILLGEDDAVSPVGAAVVSSEPAHYASTEVLPFDDSSSAVIPVQAQATLPVESPASAGAEPISLDDDFDDVLEVLDSPVSEPMAPPPRAHAKGDGNGAMIPHAGGSAAATVAAPQAETAQRKPVSRSQLRAHRNSRQFWMMVSLLFACLLGAVCWFGVGLFLKPDLSTWERKILYAMGVPARWLPPQEGEALLPTDHVKLVGKHVEWADRDDKFRDDFFELPPEKEVGNREPEVADDGPDVRNQFVNRDNVQPRNVQPRNVQPRNDAAVRNDAVNRNQQPARNEAAGGGVAAQPPRGLGRDDALKRFKGRKFSPEVAVSVPGKNNVRPNNNRPSNTGRNGTRLNGTRPNSNNRRGLNPVVTWKAPPISDDDMLRATTQGIDPKTIKTLSVETDARLIVATAGGKMFSVAEGNRLATLDMRFNEVLNSRKLDRKVAAICAASADGVSNRPSVWVLFDNGQLEKWELLNGELDRTTSVPLKPVFNEQRPVIAAGIKSVATSVGGQIFIADVLEAANKIGSTVSVPVTGQVSAMRFSDDSSKLMVVAGGQAILINAADGLVISKTPIPNLSQASSQSISDDLSTLFVARNGSIDSVRFADGVTTGRYWSGDPRPLVGVVSENENLIGLTVGSPSHAVLFSISEMVRDAAPVSVAADDVADSNLLKAGAAGVAEKHRYELSRSPGFSGRISAVQTLPGGKIAFLADDAGQNRLGVATWKGGWKVKPLKLKARGNIRGFHMSEDLSRVAVFTDDIIQSWSIEDLESGKVTFVAESVAHTKTIARIMLSNDGKRIVSGDRFGGVHVSAFDTGKRTGGVQGFSTDIIDIAARSDEGFVVMDRKGIAKGSGNSTRDKITPFGTTIIGAAALSNNAKRIAYRFGGQIRVADVHSHKTIGTIQPKDLPDFVEFSDNEKFLFLQNGQETSVWDWRKSERIRVFSYGKGKVTASAALALSDDSATVVLVTGEKMDHISIFEMPAE